MKLATVLATSAGRHPTAGNRLREFLDSQPDDEYFLQSYVSSVGRFSLTTIYAQLPMLIQQGYAFRREGVRNCLFFGNKVAIRELKTALSKTP